MLPVIFAYVAFLAIVLEVLNLLIWAAVRNLSAQGRAFSRFMRANVRIAEPAITKAVRMTWPPELLTETELVNLLSQLRDVKRVEFVAYTEARLKSGNSWGKVWKVAGVSASVNFWFAPEVRRMLAREGKSADCFRQGESWHTPLLDAERMTALCRHNRTGAIYLRVWVHGVIGERFYLENGAELSANEVRPWLKESSAYSNQGLDAPLVFKTYALAAVQELTIDGVTYKVKANRQQVAA
jgi:hypothetical protein